MADTAINYLDKRWTCAQGCDESKPCAPRCWAKREAWRMAHNGNEAIAEQYRGLVRKIDAPLASLPGESDHERLVWTGVVRINERHLLDPLHWRKPLRVGVAFGGDIGLLETNALERVMRVACGCLYRGHQLFFLTKRPAQFAERLICAMNRIYGFHWAPPAGIVIGTSISNQPDAVERLRHLRALHDQGWRTWISVEPLTGPMRARFARPCDRMCAEWDNAECPGNDGLCVGEWNPDWLVIGAESGPGARYCDPEWIRSLVDQARAWGVPCFVKQMHLGTADNFRLSHDANEWPEWARVQELPAKERA